MKRTRVWELAREYWFDALIVGGLIWWIVDAAIYVNSPGGEDGPLWFDVLAVVVFMSPLLHASTHSLWCPIESGIVRGGRVKPSKSFSGSSL